MKSPFSPSVLAGTFAVLAGAICLPFLYVHLFTALPRDTGPMEAAYAQFKFDFSSESPNALLMAVWYGLPFAWFALGTSFLLPPHAGYAKARIQIAAAGVLALVSVAVFGWQTTFLFGLPLFFSISGARKAKQQGATTL
jgi:hypothetical protein